ncbi:hypothetical protein K1719_035346 [Acacia pycnantha]|nr:hypothetical protein K1719_035346 [Acacia pycnantha]
MIPMMKTPILSLCFFPKVWYPASMRTKLSGASENVVVEELADFGATVYTCSRNEDELNKCLEAWRDQGFTVYGSVCDVSSRPQRLKLIEDVASKLNDKLNILVNNVGTNIRKPTIDYNAEDNNLNVSLTLGLHSCYRIRAWKLPFFVVARSSLRGRR